MPCVTVTVGNLTITICPKADVGNQISLDLSKPKWSETLGWEPAKVKVAIATLEGMANPVVNCQQGMNRSPTMAILYLWKNSGESLETVAHAVVEAYEAAKVDLGNDKIQILLEQLLGAYSPYKRKEKGKDSWERIKDLEYGGNVKPF